MSEKKGKAWLLSLDFKRLFEVDADYVPENPPRPEELDGEYFAFIFFGNSKVYKNIKRNIDAICSKYLIEAIKPTKQPLTVSKNYNLKMFGDRRLASLAGKKSKQYCWHYREGWTYWGLEVENYLNKIEQDNNKKRAKEREVESGKVGRAKQLGVEKHLTTPKGKSYDLAGKKRV